MDSQNPNSNYGSSSSLYFGNELSMMGGGFSRQKRFLVEFDLSDIPENATVDQAVLTLYCVKSQTGSDLSVSLYRAIRGPSPSTIAGSWTESGVTWKCKACWERSEQCNQPSVSTSSEGSITVNSTSLSAYTVSLTSLVQGWVDGTWTNPSRFTCGTIVAV